MRSIDQYLNAEALCVVKLMPKFKAGRKRGKPVNVKYNIPINFTLNAVTYTPYTISLAIPV
ncbi:MAG: energy transducer TonB [Bacteroidota bacterium]|nr:energy transducer TonB [Bacteroidota bacterium]